MSFVTIIQAVMVYHLHRLKSMHLRGPTAWEKHVRSRKYGGPFAAWKTLLRGSRAKDFFTSYGCVWRERNQSYFLGLGLMWGKLAVFGFRGDYDADDEGGEKIDST